MTTPLVPTWRIVLPYIISSFTHKLRVYVNSTGAVSAGVLQIIDRNAASLDWTAAAQGLWDTLKGNIGSSSGASVGTATMENLSAGVWNQVQSFTPITGTFGSGNFIAATQLTMVLRDSNFKKIRVVHMEQNQAAPLHSAGLYPSGQLQTEGLQFTSSGTITHFPWGWMVGRSGGYLLASPIAGTTVTLNRKLRRRRGFL